MAQRLTAAQAADALKAALVPGLDPEADAPRQAVELDRAVRPIEHVHMVGRDGGNVDAGATTADRLVTLSELIRGEATPGTDRARLFKSTGMSWEDAVIASALAQAT